MHCLPNMVTDIVLFLKGRLTGNTHLFNTLTTEDAKHTLTDDTEDANILNPLLHKYILQIALRMLTYQILYYILQMTLRMLEY